MKTIRLTDQEIDYLHYILRTKEPSDGTKAEIKVEFKINQNILKKITS